MIKICDAIMGSGKSQSAIAFMNSNSKTNFIYISPYKEDGPKISDACPKLSFVLPAHLPSYNWSKTDHCRDLLERGENIACTHELFKRYDRSILDTIQKQHYTLIIDEEVAVMEECGIHPEDLQMLLDTQYITADEDGNFKVGTRPYGGSAFRDFMRIIQNRTLNRCSDEDGSQYFYWQFPPELLSVFDDVYILTYMFECQDIKYMLDISGITYEYIYVRYTADEGYAFSASPSYLPDYVYRLDEMVDIYSGDNLNAIGTPRSSRDCPLSMSWFKTNPTRVATLKNNLTNYFIHYTEGAPSSEKMWATYADEHKKKLSHKGYATGFVVFNKKGSNDYRNRRWLAYCVNLYLPPRAKNYYQKHGIIPNEDERALSIMIQWIWRSAIRDGEKIHIYIPSERMRNLLKEWISKTKADAISGQWK